MSDGTPRVHVLAIRRAPPADTQLVTLETLAREAGLHPHLVSRLISLGALDSRGGTSTAPLYPRDAAARLARVVRLRRDLGLNYAGALLAADLIARLETLEVRLARAGEQPLRR